MRPRQITETRKALDEHENIRSTLVGLALALNEVHKYGHEPSASLWNMLADAVKDYERTSPLLQAMGAESWAIMSPSQPSS